jgi:periplasmic protein TonB
MPKLLVDYLLFTIFEAVWPAGTFPVVASDALRHFQYPLPFMTKFWGALLALGAGCPMAAAQTMVPPTRHELLDSTHTVIATATGARYRRDTEYADSVRGVVREYTLAGQLVHQSHYENLRTRQPDGLAEGWWPNGRPCVHEEYVHGKRLGEMRLYYENGQLKRRAQYGESGTSTGECFGPDGKPVPFFEYEVMPLYPEGSGDSPAIVQAIMRNTRYPTLALRRQVSAVIKVKFAVDARGQVIDVHAIDAAPIDIRPKDLPAYRALQQAAEVAVQELRPFVPGQQDGRPVTVSYTVPITFQIQ